MQSEPKRGRVFEEYVAKKLNFKQTKASGAGMQKGDIYNDQYLGECKFTAASQYIVKRSDLEKVKYQAKIVTKTPIMVIGLSHDARITEYVLMELDTFKELIDV